MGTCRICGAEGLICVSAYDSPCSWCQVCGGLNGEEFEEPSPSQAWVDLATLKAAAQRLVDACQRQQDDHGEEADKLGFNDLLPANLVCSIREIAAPLRALQAVLPPATAKEET